jgi:PAS domain S-box-containing protein
MKFDNLDKSFLVDGKYAIEDLVDLNQLRQLFEQFTRATGFTIGFLDHPGLNILIGTGWRDICTKYHRMCTLGVANCEKSNRHLLDQLDEPGKLAIEACDNGLVDCATPIIIQGKHIANLATGQLLLQEPDLDRFKRQARLFGFDEAEYLKALAEIPVVDEEKLKAVTAFLGEMALVISQMGYTRLLFQDDIKLMATEITERKRAEEALRESEDKYRFLTDKMNDIIWTADIDFNITYESPSVEKVLGYTQEERIRQKATKLLTPKSLAKVLNILNTELQSEHKKGIDPKRTATVEYECYHKNGSIVWLECVASIIRDDTGKIKGFHGVSRDITERKQAEEALQSKTALFRDLFDSSPEAIAILDHEDRVLELNQSFETLFGYSQSEARGLIINDLVAPGPYFDDAKDVSRAVIGDGRIVEKEAVRCTKDGRVIHVSLIGYPIVLNGRQIGAYAIYRDITERKLAEEERLRLEAQLMQAQKMEAIGTLAGGIAHDFNNILSAILGYSELALDDVLEPEKVKSEIKEVIKSTERAKDLVKQILTFSRKTEPTYSPLEFPSLVKESLKMLRSVIPTTIEFNQNIIKSGLVMSDPTQIYQLMMNLCTNAVYAMDKTGGVLSVSLKKVAIDTATASDLDLSPGPYLRLTISDTGHGMIPATKERIFEPYYTTKVIGRGTGLGLSVVHGIVNSHRGVITCESEPGEGTTFDVYLPEIEIGTVEAESRNGEPLQTGTECILFIDDEPALVDLAKKILIKLGYDVVTKTSSVEALELFQENPKKYDLVISDMTMPGMTGDKLLLKIMEIRHDIPIILCTGYSEHVSEEEAKRIGIREYVMKPLKMKDLAKTIRKVLDER